MKGRSTVDVHAVLGKAACPVCMCVVVSKLPLTEQGDVMSPQGRDFAMRVL